MRHLLIAGAIVLTTTAASAGQTGTTSLPTAPLTLTLVNAPLEDVLSLIARMGGITIEIDATVTEDVRRAPMPERLRFIDSTVEEVLAKLTSLSGLTYTISGPKAVRITKKA